MKPDLEEMIVKFDFSLNKIKRDLIKKFPPCPKKTKFFKELNFKKSLKIGCLKIKKIMRVLRYSET